MMLMSQSVDERPQLQDGRMINRVRFVAAVRSFEDMSTNIEYEVEDGTGMIKVKEWLDDLKENSKTAEMRDLTKKEHVYIKVTGQLKDFNGHKQVVADSIRPLSTGNELAHHMLDVVYTEQQHRKKQQQPSFTAGFGQPAGRPLHHHQAANGQHGGGGGIRDKVMEIMREASNPEMGVSMTACAQMLSGSYDASAIREAFDMLAQEGLIYSTIDEEHYQLAA